MLQNEADTFDGLYLQGGSASRTQVFVAFSVLLFFLVLLRIRRFPAAYRLIKQWPVRHRFFFSGRPNASTIVVALNRASVMLPVRTFCLTYSAALVVLLRSYGTPAELVIGVTNRPFGGHAWVESGGRVIGESNYPDRCVVLDRF